MKMKQGLQWGVLAVVAAVCLVGCSGGGADRHRLTRYRPDDSQRRPWEWSQRTTQLSGGGMPAATTHDAAATAAPAGTPVVTGYEGVGAVLRRGDGVFVYLKNIPRPEDIREEVDEVGAVTLPLIGKIQVAGMSTSQAEDAIKAAYIDGGYYRKIDVIVVADAGSYYVRGEVKRPGSFKVSGDITLVQAITTAGGYTDFARRTRVKVIRGQRDMIFNLDRIEEGEEVDPLIKPNDTIIVPRRWM